MLSTVISISTVGQNFLWSFNHYVYASMPSASLQAFPYVGSLRNNYRISVPVPSLTLIGSRSRFEPEILTIQSFQRCGEGCQMLNSEGRTDQRCSRGGKMRKPKQTCFEDSSQRYLGRQLKKYSKSVARGTDASLNWDIICANLAPGTGRNTDSSDCYVHSPAICERSTVH